MRKILFPTDIFVFLEYVKRVKDKDGWPGTFKSSETMFACFYARNQEEVQRSF